MTRYLLLLLLFAASLFSQNRSENRFSVYRETLGLVADTEDVTIQQPSSATRSIFIEHVYAYCSVVCEVTLEHDGSAASSTALTPVALSFDSPTADAFHSSNVGAGTVITKRTLAALEEREIPVHDLYLAPTGNTSNFTVRTNSITGDVRITIIFREE